MNTFENLTVGRRQLAKLTKVSSRGKYKLTDQITRASRSVTAYIAEGFGRFHYQENAQFCRQTGVIVRID
jgi:four helix bundle protein